MGGGCCNDDAGGDAPAVARIGRRWTAPITPVEPTTIDDFRPAMTLRAYGRGDDPVSLVVEWRDIPSQVTVASTARTLVGVIEQPLTPASMIVTTG